MFKIIKSDSESAEHRNIIRRLRIVLNRHEVISSAQFEAVLRQHFPEYREADSADLQLDLSLLDCTCD